MSQSSSSLNDAQYEAVYHRKGPLLVLAGAGSGKTRVITERIAALIEREVPPQAITAVTFTNKAAKEMRERLQQRLGERAKELRICTFHALGLAMVREHAPLVGRKSNVSVLAIPEQRSALRSVLQDMRLPTDADQVERLQSKISQLKNGMLEPDSSLATIRERYDALLERMNAVDFDDLMVLPIRLLAHAEVQATWQERARHFLVDEYQDSSRVQYELVRLLVPVDGNLTVVGDDDQSIYGWRGAEVRNLFQLDRDYTGLTVTRLEENYRSTEAILKASNKLISCNSERLGKTLISNLGQGKPIRVWEAATTDDEAERVVADMRNQHAAGDMQWGDFCVLFRASYQARPIEMALRAAGVPYHLTGGLSFFDRAEIRDVLSYMRLIANFTDDLAFMRAIARPRRGIGDKALGELAEFAGEHQFSLLEACVDERLLIRKGDTLDAFGQLILQLEHLFLHGEPDDAFDALLEETHLKAAIEQEAEDEKEAERRLNNIGELRRWWLSHAEKGGKLTDFIQQIYLMADREEEVSGNVVRLMTVHASKGLEFPHVYIVGVDDSSFPHKSALEENRLEEERRLMYVAMTRARFRLTLSYAKSRQRFGQKEAAAPSRFLTEMGEDCLLWVDRDTGSEAAAEEINMHIESMRKRLGLA